MFCVVTKKPLLVTLTTSLGQGNSSVTINKSEVSTQWNNILLVIKTDFYKSVVRSVCQLTTLAPVSTSMSAGSSGVTRDQIQALRLACKLSIHSPPGMRVFFHPSSTLTWSSLSSLGTCTVSMALSPHQSSCGLWGKQLLWKYKGQPMNSISQWIMLLPPHTSPNLYLSSSMSSET